MTMPFEHHEARSQARHLIKIQKTESDVRSYINSNPVRCPKSKFSSGASASTKADNKKLVGKLTTIYKLSKRKQHEMRSKLAKVKVLVVKRPAPFQRSEAMRLKSENAARARRLQQISPSPEVRTKSLERDFMKHTKVVEQRARKPRSYSVTAETARNVDEKIQKNIFRVLRQIFIFEPFFFLESTKFIMI